MRPALRLLLIVTFSFTGLCRSTPAAAESLSLGPWRAIADLPVGLGGHAAWWQGEELLVAGGTTWADGKKIWIRTIHSFHPDRGTWRSTAALPTPLAYMNLLHVPGWDGPLLVGGATGDGLNQPVVALGAAPDGMSGIPPLPQPLVYAAAGQSGGQLCLAGGADDPDDFATAHDRLTFLIRGERGWEWRQGPAVPGGARALAAGVGCGSEILVFGGARTDDQGRVINLADGYAYAPLTRRWRPLRDLPHAGRGITAVALDATRILLCGGAIDDPADDSVKLSSHAFIYDVEQDSYRPTTSLPFAAATIAVVVHDGRVYALGGEDRPRSRTARAAVATIRSLVPGGRSPHDLKGK